MFGHVIRRFLLFFTVFFLSYHQECFAQAKKNTPTKDAWEYSVGAGVLYAPVFFGSKDYTLEAFPDLEVSYGDTFFASWEDGIGYSLINQNGFSFGPLLKYEFARQEDQDNSYVIAGKKSTALQGLGTVNDAFEPGVFFDYEDKNLTAKIELRKGVGGHEGTILEISSDYSIPVGSILLSAGPRATIVDSTYNNTFFGVTETQSHNSGLSRYKAAGGLLSYGFGASVYLPLSEKYGLTLFSTYLRIAGDAESSPLITQRGSANQEVLGLIASYDF